MQPGVESLKSLDLTLLAQRLGELCQQHQLEITTAESCTGGGIASAITAIPGSSAHFATGYVTYSNAAKTRLLGVKASMLDREGAVSEAVVKAMVAGACQESGADLGVAVSGVAGPDGGSPQKPVGTVWLGWGNRQAQQAECLHFPGDRHAVREQAVHQAMATLIISISEQQKDTQ